MRTIKTYFKGAPFYIASFMEYLIAETYADHILGRNREVSSSLIFTSRLSARHLLDHEESLSFLAEIFLGSLSETTNNPGASGASTSRRLFDLIVVQPHKNRIRGRILGYIALRGLISRSALQSGIRQKGTYWARIARVYVAAFFKPEIVAFGAGAAILQILLFSYARARPYGEYWRTILALVVGFSALSIVALGTWAETNNTTTSAVKVWFICCVVIGLGQQDLAASVGTKRLMSIAEYLGVEQKLALPT